MESGYSFFVDLTISPVGISDVDITDMERFLCNLDRFTGFVPVNRSNTKYASDSPLDTLLEHSLSKSVKIFK